MTTNINDEICGPAAARWEVLKRLEKLAGRVRMEEDAYGNEASRHLDEQLREAQQATTDFVETFRRR